MPLVEPYEGERYYEIDINEFEQHWIFHNEVDLCILPIAPYVDLDLINRENIVFDISTLDESILPSLDEINGFGAIEQIIMIGYPDGIMDEFNMKPVVLSGITATSLKNDYENQKEFLIDIPCNGGSSGSPIFIYKEGAFLGGDGAVRMGIFLSFIGILYAGWDKILEDGDTEVFVKKNIISEIKLPLLGIAIKSERILEFYELIEEYLERNL